MAIEIRKSQRHKAKGRIALIAPSGAGKTLSSLLIAYGLVGDWDKIGFLDTENGSGELYTGFALGNQQVGEYLYGRIESPFTVAKYLDGMQALEDAGCEAIIIDSLSHAWAGEGGLLDKQGKLADRGGNSYAAWRSVTPEHNRLVERMLQSHAHIIACVRSKTEYVQEKDDKGKTTVRKVGLAPVQRDGLEYEFTVVFDLDYNHVAQASKDRTGMFDGQLFTPSFATGKQLRDWLESGAECDRPQFPTHLPAPGFEDRMEAVRKVLDEFVDEPRESEELGDILISIRDAKNLRDLDYVAAIAQAVLTPGEKIRARAVFAAKKFELKNAT